MSDKVYIGIVFDEYTPQVESLLTKDFIALKDAYGKDLFICCSEPTVIGMTLQALGLKVFPNMDLPNTFLVYKVGEHWPEVPENCTDKIERDLFVDQCNTEMKIDPQNPGHYLPKFGRPYVSDIHRMNYKPNGLGPVDPAIKLLWG